MADQRSPGKVRSTTTMLLTPWSSRRARVRIPACSLTSRTSSEFGTGSGSTYRARVPLGLPLAIPDIRANLSNPHGGISWPSKNESEAKSTWRPSIG